MDKKDDKVTDKKKNSAVTSTKKQITDLDKTIIDLPILKDYDKNIDLDKTIVDLPILKNTNNKTKKVNLEETIIDLPVLKNLDKTVYDLPVLKKEQIDYLIKNKKENKSLNKKESYKLSKHVKKEVIVDKKKSEVKKEETKLLLPMVVKEIETTDINIVHDQPCVKKRYKLKKKSKMVFFIILLLIGGLIYSGVNILRWYNDSVDTKEEIVEIQEMVEVEEVVEEENVEIIEQKEEVAKENPYWDYIKMSLINVDFTKLKEKNSDTKGWIQVNGTNINYPFVQSGDNEFYLTHGFDKKVNSAGWVFLDYRNDINNLGKNTILYAHGRVDKTMFGSLKNILTSGWLKKEENFVVKLSTESENTLWQVFSVYRIPTTNDYIQTSFNSSEEFLDWANVLMERSAHNFNTTINESDKVLTLSTCYNESDKVVLHAKLIKKESR